MSSPLPDLNLLNSLNQHRVTNCRILKATVIAPTITQATSFWVRNHRGTGWIIVTIDLDTFAQMHWEHSRQETRTRSLGRLKDNRYALQGIASPHLLAIITVDQFTPQYIYDIAESLTTPDPARVLCLQLHTRITN